MKRLIQVFEYEELRLHKNYYGNSLRKEELDKLLNFNDNNGNKYFIGIRDGIKFKNYVGVIQIGNLTIEILPKIDKKKSSKNEYAQWQKILLNMLKVCKHINISTLTEANLKRKNHSILDVYYEIFLAEVEILLRKGLVKNYRKQSGNVLALKGKIDFAKNIQQNLVHKERFYTQHQIYDQENTANQILLKAIIILDKISNNPLLKDKISRLKLNFPEIKETPIHKNHFNRIKTSRKLVGYKKALQISEMIILNYSPDIQNGRENMLTLLFDMNTLWEEYIYRILLRNTKNNITITAQNQQKFWNKKSIRPDIVICQTIEKEKHIYIIDTKWKIIEENEVSDNDLKQMYSYNMYWNAKRSMLLYPSSILKQTDFGNFWKGRQENETNQCKLGFINILNHDNQLDLDIGTKILEKIL